MVIYLARINKQLWDNHQIFKKEKLADGVRGLIPRIAIPVYRATFLLVLAAT